MNEPTPNAHTLTLEFGRRLTEEEFRAVVDHVRSTPYLRGLQANAVVAGLVDASLTAERQALRHEGALGAIAAVRRLLDDFETREYFGVSVGSKT